MKTALDHATQKTNIQTGTPFDAQVMDIHVTCPCCGKEQVVTVDVNRYEAWRRGELMIQHALPDLTPDQREVLLSGICPECWDKMFKEDPEL